MSLEKYVEKQYATIYKDGDRVRKCYNKINKDLEPKIDILISNLAEHHHRHPPACVKILEINPQQRWYDMEFLDGTCVNKLLGTEWQYIPQIDKIIADLAYLIRDLHKNNWLFGDLNWGAVMVGKQTRFCDVETVSPQSRMNALTKRAAFLRSVQVTHYRAAESLQFPYSKTKQSELETFALMLDELFVGEAYHLDPGETLPKELARRTRTKYPDYRTEMLPVPLRDIVKGLIEYPRKDYHINHIIKAAKKL